MKIPSASLLHALVATRCLSLEVRLRASERQRRQYANGAGEARQLQREVHQQT